MDFKDQIKLLSERVIKLKENTQTEEATKTAFIMPFLQTLGYDVFDPTEVVPEYTCDLGIKKGEKIDYAIHKDGQPIILIECKHWKEDLTGNWMQTNALCGKRPGLPLSLKMYPSNRVSNLPITSKNISKWISKIKSSC